MLKLTIKEIIERIEGEVCFEAEAADGSFYIKIEEYVPYVCAAIHNGENFRVELEEKCLLSRKERWYEEDPYTGDFIASLPIVVRGNDSRYEYDLNRSPEDCVYDTAWGKKVWEKPLNQEEKLDSSDKHVAFYKVTHALVKKLSTLYNACLIFDIHSYNYKRYDRELPVFNIGTELINQKKFSKFIDHWCKELRKTKLPNIETTVAVNDVFQGKGYFLKYISENFDNALVFATEIKKVYCDENSGVTFPKVIESIEENLKDAILNTAVYFANSMTNLKITQKQKLLSTGLDEIIKIVDEQLFKLAGDFELLSLINPSNLEDERKRFFASRVHGVNPQFKYKQVAINPFQFKKKLYEIPVEDINDIDIQNLYKDVINSFADKIDMINTIGTPEFLYNSMRYFGEPSDLDISNARFLLQCPQIIEKGSERRVTTAQLRKILEETIDHYGFKCDIEVTDNLTAAAQVINSKKLLMLKKNAKFTIYDSKILANHEVGVHMLTTINARMQPLKLFQLGFPLNTLTQEGLAVLSEYLSGSLNTYRLKELGLRSLAIRFMLKGNDFRKTFMYLVEEFGEEQDSAFYLTTRIFRGGGFTKDNLYLRGFRDMVKYYNSGKPLNPLLIGKTSLKYIDIIKEMISRRLAFEPQFKTRAFENPEANSPLLDYVIDGIK